MAGLLGRVRIQLERSFINVIGKKLDTFFSRIHFVALNYDGDLDLNKGFRTSLAAEPSEMSIKIPTLLPLHHNGILKRFESIDWIIIV